MMPQKSADFESYTLLNDSEYDDQREKPRTRSVRVENDKLALAVVAGLIVFFLVDLIAFAFIARMLLGAHSLGDQANMEFRNPYIGLDALYSYQNIKPSRYNKVINEPRLSAQISAAEPTKVFPIDPHRWLSDFGLLSPPDRHLQVSSHIHTVVQFNVLDYGMEKCTLAVRLPNRGDVLPHPYSLPETADVVRLDICELDVKRPLKEHKISWSTRPACVRKLGILEAKIGREVEMQPFSCKSGSFLGYQVSCAEDSPGCNIDVWTNHNQTWGVFVNQYQTV
jgi:hypothetical protein